ncbi:unnamed protein product, partial [Rotaria magnacalcarata]
KKPAPSVPLNRQLSIQSDLIDTQQRTTEDSLIDKIHSKQRTVSSSSSSNSNEKTHRRNENVAIVLDCSNSASLVPQQRQRHLNNIKEPDISQSKEENKITSHDNIHSTEINSDTNSSQTSSSGVSSHHDNTKISSQEITQF